MVDLIKEFEKLDKIRNAAKIKLCEENGFKYNDINKVYLIVPKKHEIAVPFDWIVFDENIDTMYLYEEKGI